MQKKIGIVIVNYNDFDTTAHLLDNIKNYKCLSEIVVVDNNSTDDSFEKLKEFESNRITIIKKVGECNIIFSNSDIIIKGEEDLNKLSSYIKGDIVVVGPTIDEHGVLNRGWRLPSSNKEILFNIPLVSRYFKKKFLQYDEEHYKGETSIVDVVSGCFFMVDSKFLKQNDYFDENTFLYYEEQILSIKVLLSKVRNANKKELVANEVKIIHDHSVSIDKSIKRVKKQKVLKTSQRYYCKQYLKANFLQMALLYITDYIYRALLYIRCIIGR